MKNTVTRVKKSDTIVPRSLEGANLLLGKLGSTQDEINVIEKDLKAKIDQLKAEAAKKLNPLTVRRDAQVNALFTFADPRKAELTRDLRSVTLSSGVFGWRLTTPRVETAQSDEETIALLKSTGNVEFVRVIEEVDRQALLAKKPIVPGITYAQSDEFFVVPAQKAKKPKTFTHAIDR